MAKEDVKFDSPKTSSSRRPSSNKDKDKDKVTPLSSESSKDAPEMNNHEIAKNASSKKSSSSKPSKSSKSSKSKKDKEKPSTSSSGKKDKKDKDSSKSSSSKDKDSSKSSSGGSSSKEKQKIELSLNDKDDYIASPKPKLDDSQSQRSFQSPTSSKRKDRRKCAKKGVCFNKSVYVNTIPNLETFKPKEIGFIWFAPDDYALMEQECDETSAHMDANRLLSSEQCARGLEAWTVNGEQNKECNVQEAIENVWQAQLEQWQTAQDTNECWEYIRGEYLPTSQRSIQEAHTIALKDEDSIQAYLNTTRQVFSQYARRVLGKAGGAARAIRRASADVTTPKSSNNRRILGQKSPAQSVTPRSISTASSRSASLRLSQISLNGTLKSSLKASTVSILADETIDEDSSLNSKRSGSRKISRKTSSRADNSDNKSVGSISYASTIESNVSGSRKIAFQPKSKTKIPTSPVGSVADGSLMDESTTSRRMRSHMSVCSDDSTRRRMLRSVGKGQGIL